MAGCTLGPVILHASRRPHGDTTADPVEWTVEASDYAAALQQARADVPKGWDLLHVRTQG
ncbi:hypothetical protein GCM10023226_40770 [Nocardioides nanhaiensis]|uniref:Uncharacterized protein n=1 Tax=Nocardioides nanhaiensis TaxID=1476871 RepID=A0ABP8X2K8_9ACTN